MFRPNRDPSQTIPKIRFSSLIRKTCFTFRWNLVMASLSQLISSSSPSPSWFDTWRQIRHRLSDLFSPPAAPTLLPSDLTLSFLRSLIPQLTCFRRNNSVRFLYSSVLHESIPPRVRCFFVLVLAVVVVPFSHFSLLFPFPLPTFLTFRSFAWWVCLRH